MHKRSIAVLGLTLGLCVPVWAQPAASPANATSGRPDSVYEYHHNDDPEEEEILDQGPAETPEKTLEFLRTNEPEVYQEITKMQTSNPEEYQHVVTMESHHVRMLEDMQTEDAAGFRLKIAELRASDRVDALARTCREKPGSDKTQLKAAVNAYFEARQQSERHELELARKELDDASARLQQRESKRASIVDHYVQEISVPDSERW